MPTSRQTMHLAQSLSLSLSRARALSLSRARSLSCARALSSMHYDMADFSTPYHIVKQTVVIRHQDTKFVLDMSGSLYFSLSLTPPPPSLSRSLQDDTKFLLDMSGFRV